MDELSVTESETCVKVYSARALKNGSEREPCVNTLKVEVTGKYFNKFTDFTPKKVFCFSSISLVLESEYFIQIIFTYGVSVLLGPQMDMFASK